MNGKLSRYLIISCCVFFGQIKAAASTAPAQEVDVPVYGTITLPATGAMSRVQSVMLQEKAFGPLHMTQVCVKPGKEGQEITATVQCMGARLYARCERGSRCFELARLDGSQIIIMGLALKNVQLLSGKERGEAIIAGDLELPTGPVHVRISMSEFGPFKTDFSVKLTEPHQLPQVAQGLAQHLAK